MAVRVRVTVTETVTVKLEWPLARPRLLKYLTHAAGAMVNDRHSKARSAYRAADGPRSAIGVTPAKPELVQAAPWPFVPPYLGSALLQ